MSELIKIYESINSGLRKGSSSRVSIDQFNKLFCIAQLKLFNDLYDKSRETGMQQDLLLPFKDFACLQVKKNGKRAMAKYPDNYGHSLSFYHETDNGIIESHPVDSDAVAWNLSSSVRGPSLERGIAYHEKFAEGVYVYPRDVKTINMLYYFCPKEVALAASYEETGKGPVEKIVEKTGITNWAKTAIPLLKAAVLKEIAPSLQASNIEASADKNYAENFPLNQ